MIRLLAGISLLSLGSGVIPYRIVWQHAVGGYGYSRAMAVAPRYRNEASLRQLGNELVDITGNDSFALINVFDSERAAAMFPRALELEGAEADYYDRHHVAIYTRNRHSGKHDLAIMLHGPAEDPIIVTY
jgi:hypothetical protein